MSLSTGKKFEIIIKEAFEKVSDVSVDRIHDQTTGYAGSTNVSDFIVYKKPYEYYIECKTVHGNRLPFTNITKNQWKGLLEKSEIKGVFAGVICWWVDKDVTRFIPIKFLKALKDHGEKSIAWDFHSLFNRRMVVTLQGSKRRKFFDYDMKQFFEEMENHGSNYR